VGLGVALLLWLSESFSITISTKFMVQRAKRSFTNIQVFSSQTHPDVCGSLVLRGVFLGTKEELDLVNQGKLIGPLFPEVFDRFINYLPEDKRDDAVKGYHELIMSDNPHVAMKAAREWNNMETSISKLQQSSQEVAEKFEDDVWNKTHARMEVHYFVNECFLGHDVLLDGCEKIKHIPSEF
jgi:proline iminopeptidase